LEEGNMEKITATKALVELKMLKKRITDKIQTSLFVSAVRGEDKKTIQQMDLEKADAEIKASKQSITALIARRNAIKTALVRANAEATVEVGGKTYTVAEAIERKNSIGYDVALLTAMKTQYGHIVGVVEAHNSKVDANLQNVLKSLGDSKTIDKASIETTVKSLRKLDEVKMFDPINIKKSIDDLEADIDKFKAEVDTALSVVNATTIIEVS
jgi:hypothetical protein